MIYSNSMKALPVISQNLFSNIVPVSTNVFNLNTPNYQPQNSFYLKNCSSSNDILSLLTDQNSQYKNVSPVPTPSINRDIFGRQINYNNIKYSLTMNKYHSNLQMNRQRHHSYENVNLLNMTDYNINNEIKNENINNNIITNNVVEYEPQKYYKSKLSKIPHPAFNKKRKQINLIPNYKKQFNNINYQFYSNQGNTQNFSTINNDINNSNSISTIINNTIDTSSNDILYGNLFPSYPDIEPGININLSEYEVLNQIGQGSEGAIYVVKWKKNNKKYALKKCNIFLETTFQKRKSENVSLRKFIDSTGCDGLIKIYGNYSKTNEYGLYEFYELMELAEKDWEKEIIRRRDSQQFYQEYELMDIFRHLIKTFALLQNNKITHRDIKPQNIMMVNGQLKICDFGNARILKRDGIIIQKIRGSELFMSPIVFKAYRSGKQQVRHNTFKSDVFSLGVCFLLAASLSFEGPNIIRQVYDMKIIKKVLDQQLQRRYSQNLINLIYTMLQIDENKRPDFVALELMVL